MRLPFAALIRLPYCMATRFAAAAVSHRLGWLLGGGLLFGLLPGPPSLTAEAVAPLISIVHPATGGTAGKPLLVALHGLGSDEHDLIELASALPSDITVVSLRAPLTLIPGHYAWFRSQRTDGCLDGNSEQIQASEQAVLATVTALQARYHPDPQRILLLGFSQGAIMSYELALAAPGRFKGIVVLSGALFDSVQQRLGPNRSHLDTRVFIAHGLADQRIPWQCARQAAAWWQARDPQVVLHLYPQMGHEVGTQELADVRQWLQQL